MYIIWNIKFDCTFDCVTPRHFVVNCVWAQVLRIDVQLVMWYLAPVFPSLASLGFHLFFVGLIILWQIQNSIYFLIKKSNYFYNNFIVQNQKNWKLWFWNLHIHQNLRWYRFWIKLCVSTIKQFHISYLKPWRTC